MPSVFSSVCPALSARCDDIWIAGPSAIGSVNGMPSSTTSAPAAGSALRMASEVSGSGSPAVTNVTSAARPSVLSSAKRRSMRVAIGYESRPSRSIGQPFAPALAHRGETDIDGSQHQYHDRADELHPFLLLQDRPGREQPDRQEIRDVGRRYDDQNPADELLPADHRLPPRPMRLLICRAAPGNPPRSPSPCRLARTGSPPSGDPSVSREPDPSRARARGRARAPG